MIIADLLRDQPGIRHAFFTRDGGVSQGIYGSLNCGFGSHDDSRAVAENRARAMEMLEQAPDALTAGYQVHSNDVAVVERPWPHGGAPKVDGLVSDRPGVVLGILTADCAPVLFADAQARVIGAAHAGWRGAKDGILEATIDAMLGLGARRERIVAAIGPAIGKASYEVGSDFADGFLADSPANAAFFGPAARDGHAMFDLQGYAAERLRGAGVESISVSPLDTCRDEDRFFSYRRSCLRGEPDYGRGLSAIVLA